ncbi:anthranilate synthase component II [Paraglaciecola marina]|uniref:anthranilate synthase component II n=1 Tax=Paraglaciecola marina TaxID=2500157 RepID=UPI00105FB5EE|nr:aminodeoxychorismate/anthranilate synthase component II [Paraglaciecola marina]
MLLLIDNYDSFTHNLARYFVELGQDVKIVRNDQISCDDIAALAPQHLVFSPGPCTPNEAGITLEAIRHFAGKIPILGVCLGHQAIGQVFGARVINANKIIHGKTAQVFHSSSNLFKGISSPFRATRYHSLLLQAQTIPKEFKVTAWCGEEQFHHELTADIKVEGEVMAIEHNSLPIFGVQFHPESLLTEYGHELLNNFLKCT